ncbi:MAG: hypothetical protein JXA42_21625 [Anaerolineales bacterium]|nr:hypothetical protein [Anaerolineales bacterium]
MNLQTEFEFTLPRGYVDESGNMYKNGVMRLATAIDEIAPLRDPRVQANEAYLNILLLARVITKLGPLREINSGIIERLFSADMAYLQEFYRRINQTGHLFQPVTCPNCQQEFEVEYAPMGGED